MKRWIAVKIATAQSTVTVTCCPIRAISVAIAMIHFPAVCENSCHFCTAAIEDDDGLLSSDFLVTLNGWEFRSAKKFNGFANWTRSLTLPPGVPASVALKGVGKDHGGLAHRHLLQRHFNSMQQ